MNYEVFGSLCSQVANYIRGEIHDLRPRGDFMSGCMMDALRENEAHVIALTESPQMRVLALEYLAYDRKVTIELSEAAKTASRHGTDEWDEQVHTLVDSIVPTLAVNIGLSERLVRQFIFDAISDDTTWLGEAVAGVIAEITVMKMLRNEFEIKDE